MYETTGPLPSESERLSPAFEGFYLKYANFALRYANTLASPAQAEEAVSVAVTNTWAEVANGRFELSETPDDERLNVLKSYLFTAIRNAIGVEGRKMVTRKRNMHLFEVDVLPGSEEETTLFADELMVCMGAALKEPIDIELLLLDADGFSPKEAALALGMKEGTHRSRLSRARSRLKNDPDFMRLAAGYGYRA